MTVIERDGRLLGRVVVTLRVPDAKGIHPVGIDLNETNALVAVDPDGNTLFVSGRDVKVYGFCAEGEPTTDVYPGCVAQEPQLYGQLVIEQIALWLDGGTPEHEVLQPLKVFSGGEQPADNELG